MIVTLLGLRNARACDGASNNTTLCRQRNAGAGTLETWFALTADNALFAGVRNYAYPGWHWLGFATEVPEDEWAHVALVTSGSGLTIYKGGQLTGTTTVGWQIGLAGSSAAPLNFGGDDLEGNHVQGRPGRDPGVRQGAEGCGAGRAVQPRARPDTGRVSRPALLRTTWSG